MLLRVIWLLKLLVVVLLVLVLVLAVLLLLLLWLIVVVIGAAVAAAAIIVILLVAATMSRHRRARVVLITVARVVCVRRRCTNARRTSPLGAEGHVPIISTDTTTTEVVRVVDRGVDSSVEGPQAVPGHVRLRLRILLLGECAFGHGVGYGAVQVFNLFLGHGGPLRVENPPEFL